MAPDSRLFLTGLGERTDAADDDRSPESFRAGDLLVGRYRLEGLLGVGGFGEVWGALAEDDRSPVAIKLLPTLSERDQGRVRREIAALRWARLPGVVRMLDDGHHGSTYFIVMERLEGVPFPGQRTPLSWAALRAPTLKLLEILARVHHSGLIHRDLKPRNILVSASGAPTLLDLGIATGRALGHSFESRAYTPAYAAPEQIRAEPCDERTDLYALGVMLYEALAGALPHDPHRRDPSPAHPYTIDIPGLDADSRALLARLMHPDPAQRPASALAVIAALGGQLPPLLGGGGLDLPPYASADALRALFHGPDAFLHLREDAAEELWARTFGEKSAVEAELGAWLRAGLTHWEDGALRIDRDAIERLQGGLRLVLDDTPPPANDQERTLLRWLHLAWPETPRGWLAQHTPLSPEDFDAACARLLQSGRIWTRPDGRLSCRLSTRVLQTWDAHAQQAARTAAARHLPKGAIIRAHLLLQAATDNGTVAREILDIVSAHPETTTSLRQLVKIGVSLSDSQDTATKEALLIQLALYATRLRLRQSIDDALFELSRLSTASTGKLEAILHAQRLILENQPHHAIALLREAETDQDALEVLRTELLTEAMFRQQSHSVRDHIAGLEAWAAATPGRQRKLLSWRGLYAYSVGDFAQAAQLHEAALRGEASPEERVASLLNASSAHLECGAFAEAMARAEEARTLARRSRHPRYEALGCYLSRNILYRTDAPLQPAPDHAAAGYSVAAYIGYLFSVLESAVCWRQHDPDTARTLIARALTAADKVRPEQRLLIQSLALYLGVLSEDTVIDTDIARNPRNEKIIAQAAALLLRSRPAQYRAYYDEATAKIALEARENRLDVLSLREILAPDTIPPPHP